jgi:hypothetical protein
VGKHELLARIAEEEARLAALVGTQEEIRTVLFFSCSTLVRSTLCRRRDP